MTKALSKANDYLEFLGTIKNRIRDARISAAKTVNKELILWLMRQFFLEYRDSSILQQLVGEIPWEQNLLIGTSKNLGLLLRLSASGGRTNGSETIQY